MSDVLFSIIIPTYNHAHLIERCLNSVISQTYHNWEAIVINNFSEDNTIEVVEQFKDSRIRLVNYANNGIIAASRNRGILEAKGEWICFLDSDDWWANNKLEECLFYLSNYDIIYHDFSIYRENNIKVGAAKKIKGRVLNRDLIADMLVNGNAIVTSSVVVRRDIIMQVGMMCEDKTLVGVEDYDYWLRIMKYTNRVKYIPKLLGFYYIGQNTSGSIKQIDKLTAIYNKYKKELSESDRIKTFVRIRYDQARLYHMNGNFMCARKAYIEALKGKYNVCKSLIGYLLTLFHYQY
ncbi:glycosyltransferase family 2 protein [Coprobacter fastidiosus]|uniref:glycosyltransferase family 2 protein n=1 Tax=Coprobacter fastidiosus TaxID=1099853 RepID=UPI003207C143